MAGDGEAYVDVGAQPHKRLQQQLNTVRTRIQAELKKIEEQKAEVGIGADFSRVEAAASEVNYILKRIDSATADPEIGADTTLFERGVSLLKAQLTELKAARNEVDVTIKEHGESRLGQIQAELTEMTTRRYDVEILGQTGQASRALAEVRTQAIALDKMLVEIETMPKTAQTIEALRLVKADIKAIDRLRAQVRVDAETFEFNSKILEARETLEALAARSARIPILADNAQFIEAAAEVTAISEEIGRISPVITTQSRSKEARADLLAIDALRENVDGHTAYIDVKMRENKAQTELLAFLAEVRAADETVRIKFLAETGQFGAAIAAINAQMAELEAMRVEPDIGADISQFEIKAAAVQARLAALKAQHNSVWAAGSNIGSVLDTSPGSPGTMKIGTQLVGDTNIGPNLFEGVDLTKMADQFDREIEKAFGKQGSMRRRMAGFFADSNDVSMPFADALDRDLNKADGHLTRFQRRALLWTAGINAAFAAGGVGIAAYGLKVSSEIEQSTIAFEGILTALGQQEGAGADMVSALQKFAAKTPFEFDQLTKGSQQLLGSGVAKNKAEVLDVMGAIGGMGAVLGKGEAEINRFILALTQVGGKGRLAGEEVRQMAESFPGFNAYAQIAKIRSRELGDATYGVAEAMDDGKKRVYSGTQAIEYLVQAMKEYPGAADAMIKQSQTLLGRLSTVKDEFKITLNDLIVFDPEGGDRSMQDIAKQLLEEVATGLQDGGGIKLSLGNLIGDVGSGFENLTPSLVPFVASLLDAMGTLSDGFLTGLAPLLDGMTEALPPLAELFARLAVVIGEVGGNVLSSLVTPLSILTGVLDALPVGLLVVLVDGLIALKVASAVAGAVNSLALALQLLAPGLALAGTMAGLAGPLGLLAGAVAVGALAWGAFAKDTEEASARTKEMESAIQSSVTTLVTSREKLADLYDSGQLAAEGTKMVSEALSKTGVDGEKLTDSLGRVNLQVRDTVAILATLRDASSISSDIDFSAAFPTFDTIDVSQLDAATTKVVDNVVGLMQKSGEFAGLTKTQLRELAVVLGDTEKDIGSTFRETTFADGTKGFESIYDSSLHATAGMRDAMIAFEELQDQAEKTDLADIAEGLINNSVAQGTATTEMIRQAERAAVESGLAQGFSLEEITRTGSAAFLVWNELLRIMGLTASQEIHQPEWMTEWHPPLMPDLTEAGIAADGAGAMWRGAGDAALDAGTDFLTAAQELDELDTAFANTLEAGEEFKKFMDGMTGSKLDLTQAKAELADWRREFSGKDSKFNKDAGLNFNVEGGSDNLKILREATDAITEIASLEIQAPTFDGNWEAIGLQVAGLQEQFAQDVTLKLGLDPTDPGELAYVREFLKNEGFIVPVGVVIDEARKASFTNDLEAITKVSPEIAATIKSFVDKGDYDTAQSLLDLLGMDTNTTVYASADVAKANDVLKTWMELDHQIAIGADTTKAKADFDAAVLAWQLVNPQIPVGLVLPDNWVPPVMAPIEIPVTYVTRPSVIDPFTSADAAERRIGSMPVSLIPDTTALDALYSEVAGTPLVQGVDADTAPIMSKLDDVEARRLTLQADAYVKTRIDVDVHTNVVVTPTNGGKGATATTSSKATSGGGKSGRSSGDFAAGGLTDTLNDLFIPGSAVQELAKMRPGFATGPMFGFGEPSTQGEAFISFNPNFASRSRRILMESARRLGMEVMDPKLPHSPPIVHVIGAELHDLVNRLEGWQEPDIEDIVTRARDIGTERYVQSIIEGHLTDQAISRAPARSSDDSADRLARVVDELRELRAAVMSNPPIHLHDSSGSAALVASTISYKWQERTARLSGVR